MINSSWLALQEECAKNERLRATLEPYANVDPSDMHMHIPAVVSPLEQDSNSFVPPLWFLCNLICSHVYLLLHFSELLNVKMLLVCTVISGMDSCFMNAQTSSQYLGQYPNSSRYWFSRCTLWEGVWMMEIGTIAPPRTTYSDPCT